jgi:signal transduction histidine kinase
MLPFSIAMILAFGYGMLAPSFHTSLWTGLTAYVLYWITVSFTQISVASLVTNAHFLTLSIFAVLVGTFVREKLEREGANAQHELAKVNGELIEAGLAKDRLLASVSHELRTPVNAIAGFSEIMQQGLFGQVEPARYRSYVDDIQTSALLLKTGIDDLLDVSRLGVQKIAWEDSLTPVADIVSDSVAFCQADATEAGITITLEPDLTSAAVRTDRQRLAQTLVNVIVNAIKFSGRGSEVRVGAQLDDAGGVIVTISDTGCGIAPDDLARIREPFGQVHSDQYSARKRGLGLGLAIATGFMERMDGRLDIESVPGKGTIVSIILPPDRVGPCAEKGRRSDRALSA